MCNCAPAHTLIKHDSSSFYFFLVGKFTEKKSKHRLVEFVVSHAYTLFVRLFYQSPFFFLATPVYWDKLITFFRCDHTKFTKILKISLLFSSLSFTVTNLWCCCFFSFAPVRVCLCVCVCVFIITELVTWIHQCRCC